MKNVIIKKRYYKKSMRGISNDSNHGCFSFYKDFFKDYMTKIKVYGTRHTRATKIKVYGTHSRTA